MGDFWEQVNAHRLIAVIRLADYAPAVPLAHALFAGGIRCFEWTLTGTGALAAIAATRAALPTTASVGVGTVLHPTEGAEAIAAGAQFVVTPAVRPAVVAVGREHAIPVICGALTPTEVLAAAEAGAGAVKIFPARLGGPSHIRDLRGPFPHLRFIPTGGIDETNAPAYLAAGAYAVGIGGNLVEPGQVMRAEWAALTATATRYTQICARASEAHDG